MSKNRKKNMHDEKEFLFCDYAYSENKDDDIYSGIIGDWYNMKDKFDV